VAKILINNTGSDIELADVGVTVESGNLYTIPPQNYNVFAASSDVIYYLSLGESGLVLNDGGNDITVLSNAIDIIKGWPVQPSGDVESPFFFDYFDVPIGAGPHIIIETYVDEGTTLDLTRLYINCRMESIIQVLKNGEIIGSLRTGAANPTASFDWRPNQVCVVDDIIQIVLTKRTGAPDIDVGAHLMGVTKQTL